MDLYYQILPHRPGDQRSGTGKVQDISSRGLAFRTDIDVALCPGQCLRVSLAWPAKLDGQCLLRLVFNGGILRVSGDLVVMTIGHPEFRTAGQSIAPDLLETATMAPLHGLLPGEPGEDD
jgi:hypothetical protein